jgi:hypothetical protein
MSGYTRQSSYVDGDVIQASDSNAEFDQLVGAFNNIIGHAHDGTASEGPVIGFIGDAGVVVPLNKVAVDTGNDRVSFYTDVSGVSTEQLRIEDGVAYPVANNDVDLGTTVYMFKDGFFAGTLKSVSLKTTNISANDGASSATIADGTGVFTIASAVLTTADINGGTIDNTVIGGTTPLAGNFTAISATGNITVGGTVDGRDVAVDGTKLDGVEALADVTDTTNVTAAGALMDSELTNISAVKALNQGVASTDSPTFVTINSTNIDSTNIEVTNIKAKDGTASATIADGTGVMTIPSAVLSTADINGGTVDGTAIGSSVPAAASVTSLTATTADIDGGSIDGATIGSSVPAAASVTSLTATAGGSLTGTWSDLGTVTTIDLNGGTVDGTEIGSSSPSSATVTTLTVNTSATLELDQVTSTSDLQVSEGGTGSSTASGARTNLDVDQAGTALALAIALG